MDNDPWKQKVAVQNFEHVVKETSSNDVAAELSENCCLFAPASEACSVRRGLSQAISQAEAVE